MEITGHQKAEALFTRASELILGGTQTLSKHPSRFPPGDFPIYAEHGRGSRLWDIDGNEYIDFIMALGPMILGYSNPAVNAAIARQIECGTLFSLSSPLEVELAEEIVSAVPCAEVVRFFNTGAEATQAAVRVARVFTGRDLVISCGYHGWHDWVGAKNKSEPGIPHAMRELVLDLPYGDCGRLEELLRRHRGRVACVIVEPVARDASLGFLQGAQRLTGQEEVVLIFDEIVTGFRLSLGGAQSCFEVTPDLATFGKALANGLPLAALAGKRGIMTAAANSWISSTYAGCTLGLAAALATIRELKRGEVFERIWALGQRLAVGWREMLRRYPVSATVAGIGPLPLLLFKHGPCEEFFMRRLLRGGVLFRKDHYWFVSGAHTEGDIDRALELSESAFRECRETGLCPPSPGADL
ncbi:MAG: aminotransferase class III-fold pyridoxal phosphate-dependent enzyme [Acidobacteriota bacterium]